MNKSRRWVVTILGILFAGVIMYYYFWKRNNPEMTLFGTVMQQPFWYQVLYTVLVLGFGIPVIYKYKDPYITKRTYALMFFQLALGLLAPYLLPDQYGGGWGGNDPNQTGLTVFLFRIWPLSIKALIFRRLIDAQASQLLAKMASVFAFYFYYGVIVGVILMPIAVFFLGRRVYCSWSCACAGLAENFGDPWRHRAPKGRIAEAVEYVIYPLVIVAIYVTIAGFLVKDVIAFQKGVLSQYEFWMDFFLAGVIGVGLYPVAGSRPWCRYFCPWAGLFGLIALKGRFAIKVEKDLCMACGQCNHICEMGIDIRKFAMNNKDVKTATCVGCGACVTVCPRKVLSIAPIFGRDWMKELKKANR